MALRIRRQLYLDTYVNINMALATCGSAPVQETHRPPLAVIQSTSNEHHKKVLVVQNCMDSLITF